MKLPFLSKDKRAKVIIDTNFLLLPGSAGVDIFTGIEQAMTLPFDFYVIDKTFYELKRIIDGKTLAKGKDKFNAKLGFILAKQKGLKTLKSSSKESLVDDSIVDYANEDVFVATLDKNLQKRVSAKSGHILTIRQKSHIVIKS